MYTDEQIVSEPAEFVADNICAGKQNYTPIVEGSVTAFIGLGSYDYFGREHTILLDFDGDGKVHTVIGEEDDQCAEGTVNHYEGTYVIYHPSIESRKVSTNKHKSIFKRVLDFILGRGYKIVLNVEFDYIYEWKEE